VSVVKAWISEACCAFWALAYWQNEPPEPALIAGADTGAEDGAAEVAAEVCAAGLVAAAALGGGVELELLEPQAASRKPAAPSAAATRTRRRDVVVARCSIMAVSSPGGRTLVVRVRRTRYATRRLMDIPETL
jgi:hypothetical protein